ncbi:hypothetical protein ACU8KH_03699 [Lachancea thermotolerans]
MATFRNAKESWKYAESSTSQLAAVTRQVSPNSKQSIIRASMQTAIFFIAYTAGLLTIRERPQSPLCYKQILPEVLPRNALLEVRI